MLLCSVVPLMRVFKCVCNLNVCSVRFCLCGVVGGKMGIALLFGLEFANIQFESLD